MAIKCRVLVVDDSKEWADFVCKEISNDKISVETSYEVSDALRKIETKYYDIIFCDIKMTFDDEVDAGFLILKKAKQFLPQAKVIMVTAYDSSAVAVKTLRDERSYYYLVKDTDETVDVIKIRRLILKIIDEQQRKPLAPNPFNAQLGQCPSYIIANRKNSSKSEMDLLIECLERSESGKLTRFLLTGERGTGKTCILKHFRNYLSSKGGYGCTYYRIPENMGINSPTDIIINILLGIIDGFPKVRRLDFKHFFEFIKKIGIKIEAFGFKVAAECETQQVKSISPNKLLEKGISSLWSDLAKKEISPVVLLIDDLQNLENCQIALWELMRLFSELQFESESIVFGASLRTETINNKNVLRLNQTDLGRYFAGRIVSLGNFTREEVAELAEQSLYDTGVIFHEPVIDSVYSYTNGHPYHTQVLLYHLYENQQKGIVNESLLKKALNESLSSMMACIPEVYGSISDDEETVLRVIANFEEGANFNEIRHKLVDLGYFRIISNVDLLCNSLKDKGILQKVKRNKYVWNDKILLQAIKAANISI